MENDTITHWIPTVITVLNALALIYVIFWQLPTQVGEIRAAVLGSIPKELENMRNEVKSLKEAQSAQRFPTNEQTLAILELGIERSKFNMLHKIPKIVEQTKGQSVDTAKRIIEHVVWDALSYTRDRWDKFYDKKLGNLRVCFKDKMIVVRKESIEEALKILSKDIDDAEKQEELRLIIERAAHKAMQEVRKF